jgi:hypothetical protein
VLKVTLEILDQQAQHLQLQDHRDQQDRLVQCQLRLVQQVLQDLLVLKVILEIQDQLVQLAQEQRARLDRLDQQALYQQYLDQQVQLVLQEVQAHSLQYLVQLDQQVQVQQEQLVHKA